MAYLRTHGNFQLSLLLKHTIMDGGLLRSSGDATQVTSGSARHPYRHLPQWVVSVPRSASWGTPLGVELLRRCDRIYVAYFLEA